LYTKIREQNPGQKIAVGLWHFSGDPAQLVRRLGLKEGASAFTTLAEVIQEIQELSTPNAPLNETPNERNEQSALRIASGDST
jgi:hypothetical protein